MLASDCTASVVKPAGASAPTNAFDNVTPRASAPAPTATVPGSATVAVEPDPAAALCDPTTCVVTASTPLQAEMSNPPSVTDSDRSARTARMLSFKPTQKKVATIASPCWGFVLLNPFMKNFPLSLSALFNCPTAIP